MAFVVCSIWLISVSIVSEAGFSAPQRGKTDTQANNPRLRGSPLERNRSRIERVLSSKLPKLCKCGNNTDAYSNTIIPLSSVVFSCSSLVSPSNSGINGPPGESGIKGSSGSFVGGVKTKEWKSETLQLVSLMALLFRNI